MLFVKKKVKRVLVDALVAFIFYTLALTPYMVLIVRMDLTQYLAWIVMQIFLVPPLGAIFAWICRKIGD